MLQSTIRQSGAVDRVEQLIERNVRKGKDALRDSPVREDAAMRLEDLAARAAMRVA